MPKAVRQRFENEWDKELAKVNKSYYKDEMLKLYSEKKLKDGEIVWLKGCMLKVKGSDVVKEAIALGMVMHGKFVFVRYSKDDRRIKKLKRNGIAKLLEIKQTGMVNVRQVPWVPHRFQSIKNPGFTLHGADSMDDDFEGKRFKDKPQIFHEGEILSSF